MLFEIICNRYFLFVGISPALCLNNNPKQSNPSFPNEPSADRQVHKLTEQKNFNYLSLINNYKQHNVLSRNYKEMGNLQSFESSKFPFSPRDLTVDYNNKWKNWGGVDSYFIGHKADLLVSAKYGLRNSQESTIWIDGAKRVTLVDKASKLKNELTEKFSKSVRSKREISSEKGAPNSGLEHNDDSPKQENGFGAAKNNTNMITKGNVLNADMAVSNNDEKHPDSDMKMNVNDTEVSFEANEMETYPKNKSNTRENISSIEEGEEIVSDNLLESAHDFESSKNNSIDKSNYLFGDTEKVNDNKNHDADLEYGDMKDNSGNNTEDGGDKFQQANVNGVDIGGDVIEREQVKHEGSDNALALENSNMNTNKDVASIISEFVETVNENVDEVNLDTYDRDHLKWIIEEHMEEQQIKVGSFMYIANKYSEVCPYGEDLTEEIRLPNTLRPRHYHIHLFPHIYGPADQFYYDCKY